MSSPRRTNPLARILIWVAFLGVLGGGSYFYARAFKPHWFDREEENRAALDALKSATLTPATVAGTDWPQWLGPTRDGRAPASPLRTDWTANPPTKLWESTSGGGYSSFAVVGDRLYTQDKLGEQERVRCLNAATGADIWTHETKADYTGIGYGSGPRATPTIRGERIYAVGAGGDFVCLEQKPTGPPALLWSHDYRKEFRSKIPQWGYAGSPLLEGDLVIVQPGGKDGSIVAFDASSGAKKWAAGSDDAGYSSPVAATAAGVRQIIAVTANAILGIRPESGEVLWQYEWRTQFGGNIATPQVVGDYVFASSDYDKGCVLLKLSAAGGGVSAEPVYFRKNRVMRNHHATSVHRDGYLYGCDKDAYRCVDLRAGQVKEEWVAADGNGRHFGKGNLILADKYLIGQTERGVLFLAEADPAEFKFHGKLEGVISGADCWALPVLANGRLYVRDGAKIVCLDVR